jgi:hypothetical protein
MSLPKYELSLLIFLGIVVLVGEICHQAYLWRVQTIVKKTADSAFDRKDLMEALHIFQGSNFNTLMLLSWSLFLVALVFLYFLTPDIFPNWNYFLFPRLASESYGLVILGLFVALISILLISFIVPRVYSYYLISRWVKEWNLITPVLLIVSIFCSISLATIYPMTDGFIWNIGYWALFFSLILMLAPIIIGFGEEIR